MTWTYAFDRPPEGTPDQLRTLLGGKGANLAIMATELGLPVPPGFVITTEACKAWMADGWPGGLDAELREQVALLGQRVGRGFGDPVDPLLVSVRSGAPVSMPGMLDTILNLGLTDETSQGLARASGDPAFAAACRARLETMYREIVGQDEIPSDPWDQLRSAIQAVFQSWESDRARSYRKHEGIPADLGTAVVVQAMVFGNRGRDSATGVLFTRNPATGERTLYGDILFGAQGEDVVAGTHATEPLTTLDDRLPAVAAELREHADRLERYNADICDIEFTIEEGRLWLLQNRVGKRTALAACRAAVEMAQDESFPLSRAEAVERVRDHLADPPTLPAGRNGDPEVIATGLAASPGLASGAIATSPEAAVVMADVGTTVLLVRSETSPDDVHGMARSAGILTATGGLASHAAVVARGWDIPAVVGVAGLLIEARSVTLGGRHFVEGDVLSIDGSTGEVFAGLVSAVSEVMPEVSTLLAWAKDLGIEVGRDAPHPRAPRLERTPGDPATDDFIPSSPSEAGSGTGPASVAGPGPSPLPADLIRALVIKGYVTPDLLAPALDLTPDAAQQALSVLVGDGLARESGDMFSLTEEGKVAGSELLDVDRRAWGPARASGALDGFLGLDGRMKSVVTAWQMKEIDGQPVLNDHADAAYDAAVLADLTALHADASAWIGPLVSELPRLAGYARRLDRAAEAATGGDPRFIASPRVDSYHGIWFELHEDLIRLAGRTREQEVAAGRA